MQPQLGIRKVAVAMLSVPGGDGLQVDLDRWRGQLTQAEGSYKMCDCPLGSRECCDVILMTEGLELVDAGPIACCVRDMCMTCRTYVIRGW